MRTPRNRQLTPENIQRILALLQKLRDSETLKQLFWVELNYERIDMPVSVQELPIKLKERLNGPPRRFAAAGNNNGFNIIYTQLKTEVPRKTDERGLIAALQPHFPHALYVFSNPAQEHWHFVNVKTVLAKRENMKPKHHLRRITVSTDERLRTAAECIAMLNIEMFDDSGAESLLAGSEAITPLQITALHDNAFDVEAVTKAFFEHYKNVFKTLQAELEKQTGDKKWAHDYAQQFLSRCLFLYFIQRKRWLGNDTAFLRTFWTKYRGAAQPADTFVEKWLNLLFFEAFNNRFHGGHRHFPDDIRETLQLAPYLNGGLFRENELDTAYPLLIADELWSSIFDFFERYNFTIAEDTPLEQEVAVDPEMIGKVYESLVSAEESEKGDAGIFYTPRIEIDLMCRIALVDNIANHIGTVHKPELYEALFEFDDTEKEAADAKLRGRWEAIAEHLNHITVLDPACGSGSFLVGMLQILDDVHQRAERILGKPASSSFERRKAIIGKNLYGVDVKPWACKVAELRLWLALIIDAEFTPAELQVRREPLLPDFSFNIRHGDSIVQDIGGMNLAQIRAIGSRLPPNIKRKITELQSEKLKFYNGDEGRKYTEKGQIHKAEQNLFRELLQGHETALSEQIDTVKAWLENPAEQLNFLGIQSAPRQLGFDTVHRQNELQSLQENRENVRRATEALAANTTMPPFVWDIAFVEIFNQRRGFDIIVENPPYVRGEKIAEPTLPRIEVTTANKKEYKEKLARSVYQAFPDFFGYEEKKTGRAKQKRGAKNELYKNNDLYVYFYLQGLSLLNSEGTFCTITSNSWLDVGYGKNLQEFLLKRCHLKLVLDNAAKRSFSSANINTVICLISAPDKKRESALAEMTRFVNFTVPFEGIFDPVIFYEIETAPTRTTTPEHGVHSRSRQSLLQDGLDENRKYSGDKWGGKYFRAPDIYPHLLEKAADKLTRVGDIANIRRGFTTGANEFFVLDEETLSTWNVEAEFLHPVIDSPKSVKSLSVNPGRLPHLFMCPKEKSTLSGTAALAYIEWGEQQNLHRRATCQSREKTSSWYNVGERRIPHLSFPSIINAIAKTLYASEGCYSLDSFAEVHVSTDLRLPLCLSLNSTLFQLMANVGGRTNSGGGALVVKIYELKNLQCVNPEYLTENKQLGGGVNDSHLSLLESAEWDLIPPGSARINCDNLIFDILGLTAGERDGVYEVVTRLVGTRLDKAKR